MAITDQKYSGVIATYRKLIQDEGTVSRNLKLIDDAPDAGHVGSMNAKLYSNARILHEEPVSFLKQVINNRTNNGQTPKAITRADQTKIKDVNDNEVIVSTDDYKELLTVMENEYSQLMTAMEKM